MGTCQSLVRIARASFIGGRNVSRMGFFFSVETAESYFASVDLDSSAPFFAVGNVSLAGLHMSLAALDKADV